MERRNLFASVALVVAFAGTGQAQSSPPVRAASVAPAYGTAAVSYYRIGAPEFEAEGSTGFQWFSGNYVMSFVPNLGFWATPHLPSGALLTSIELDSCDSSTASEHVILSTWDCDRFGNCSALRPPFASVSDVVNPCGFLSVDVSSSNYTIDNLTHIFNISVNLESGNATNQLYGVVIGYKLQVSPAPATATFNDVPLDSPQFQFIEALAASGITAGCGGGNYCPNNPLTRGQMAVFLAKALGLQFQ
jgi:hypothetical protein